MRHLVRLVDDLLDVSRITHDRLELKLQQVRLSDLIATAMEIVQPMVLAARQQIHLEIPDGPQLLAADPDRLAQVFANLLSNASKFSDAGATIDICAVRDGDSVSVSVRDSGIGLGNDHLSYIFDLFAQVDTSLQRSRGGLGIGLTLAKRLVEMHGGRLVASSAGLGHGSDFTVSLPLLVEPSVDHASKRSILPAPAERALRVMVVDDNKDSADMLALSLKMMGHDVIAFHDPLAVVDAALGYVPDVVFMDVGMPVMNGFALAAQLRAQQWPGDRRPRLVALTGWGQEEDRHRSQEAGFDEHLVKPADLETIERVCRQTTQLIEVREVPAA